MPDERWPTDSPRITGNYGEARSNGRPHSGLDIANPVGSPVYATQDGVAHVDRGPSGENQIKIDDVSGNCTGYAHVAPSVRSGDSVEAGDVIGHTDMSGNPTGPHLHYSKRPGECAQRNPTIDPRPLMNPSLTVDRQESSLTDSTHPFAAEDGDWLANLERTADAEVQRTLKAALAGGISPPPSGSTPAMVALLSAAAEGLGSAPIANRLALEAIGKLLDPVTKALAGEQIAAGMKSLMPAQTSIDLGKLFNVDALIGKGFDQLFDLGWGELESALTDVNDESSTGEHAMARLSEEFLGDLKTSLHDWMKEQVQGVLNGTLSPGGVLDGAITQIGEKAEQLLDQAQEFVFGATSTASIPVARIGDPNDKGGVVKTGAPTVLVTKMPAARTTDVITMAQPVDVGTIMTGNPTILVEGQLLSGVGHIGIGAKATVAASTVGEPTVLMGKKFSVVLPDSPRAGGESGANKGSKVHHLVPPGEGQAATTVPTAPPGADVDANMEEAAQRLKEASQTQAPWLWFRDQVRNGGPWDYKQQGSQYEDFGNFNYGATGCAVGFSEETLLREAGRAQQQAGTSRPEWGDPGSLMPWGDKGSGSYGDDPKDQESIKNGYEYCKQKKGK